MSDDRIVVTERVFERLVIADETLVIHAPATHGPIGALGPTGPTGVTGPVGPQGPQGEGTNELAFNFAVASTLWVIGHDLGTKAIAVLTFDSDGTTEKEGTVTYLTENLITVEFYYPESGIARLLY